MITIVNRHHAARVLRHLRETRRLSRLQVAERLFVSQKTVGNRERCTLGISTQDLVDMAHVFGYVVALVPQRHPGARPTGTGWPL